MPIEGGFGIFKHQTPKVLNQTNPVQNTWYTIGLVTGVMTNARVYQAAVNIEDTNETLEVQVIIDGITLPTIGKAATHSISHRVFQNMNAIDRTVSIELKETNSNTWLLEGWLFEGKSIEIQVRKTTVAGTGNLTGIVDWGQLSSA